MVSNINCHQDFARFHNHINFLSLHYPTAKQTLAIAREHMNNGQILVIVGGNSVLHGSYLSDQQVWTKHLQLLLGDRYCVLNFALPGMSPTEFGALVADLICRQYERVIFVTYSWPGATGVVGEADGRTLRYFYWDAYHKGLIDPDAARDARIELLTKWRAKDANHRELVLRSRIDSYLYCQDLWTTFSYSCRSTIWTPMTSSTFTRPRKQYQDLKVSIPAQYHYLPENEQAGMQLVRNSVSRHWTGDPAASPLAESIRYCLPTHLRPRSLVLIAHHSPRFVHRLTASEQQAYHAMFPETIEAVASTGCQACELGRGYTELDYIDQVHSSSDGAVKMAAEVTPRVQELARQLGYLNEE